VDPHYIQEFIMALLRELSRNRVLAALAFACASLIILAIGLVWPMQYQTSAVLYIDERNIIKPLLSGQAEIQDIDQSQSAKEKIYTRRILEKVAVQAGLLSEDADSKEIARVISMLSGGALGRSTGIQISSRGRNYISLSYKDPDPEMSFNVINGLISAFILNVAETKRIESRGAYDFIEGQVELYKQKLKAADERLKEFNAANRDGSTQSVAARISSLRSDIEDISLSINDLNSRYQTIEKQIKNESQYLNVQSKTDIYRERIRDAQARMDTLLLSFTETHPDVVTLKLQINDQKQAILDIQAREALPGQSENNEQLILNPLMEELRSSLSETEIKLNSAVNREKALQRLLNEEHLRSKRLVEKQADLSELTRDYDVTQKLYEDMLNRREKARLSMTLDIEGQGTSYKVHEPPTFPLSPSGLRTEQFIMGAPFLGLMVPIGIIGMFIFFDPRIRLPSDLNMIPNAEILAISAPIKNVAASHTMRKDTLWSIAIILMTAAAYGWLVLNYFLGAN
jgi:polysaccharide chain length determinant protein (PEP-CTERM system associated)